MFNWYLILQSVVLMFLYVEQDVNWQNQVQVLKFKNSIEKFIKSGKKLLCSQEGMG